MEQKGQSSPQAKAVRRPSPKITNALETAFNEEATDDIARWTDLFRDLAAVRKETADQLT